MRGIRMEKDIILYYGNAAGYVSGGKAVVDPLFESQELKDFLTRQKDVSEVKWTDGVFDRLINGQRETHEITPLKNCRIWQLKPESDILMRFISYDEMVKNSGNPICGITRRSMTARWKPTIWKASTPNSMWSIPKVLPDIPSLCPMWWSYTTMSEASSTMLTALASNRSTSSLPPKHRPCSNNPSFNDSTGCLFLY